MRVRIDSTWHDEGSISVDQARACWKRNRLFDGGDFVINHQHISTPRA